jgi:hypothetical protein
MPSPSSERRPLGSGVSPVKKQRTLTSFATSAPASHHQPGRFAASSNHDDGFHEMGGAGAFDDDDHNTMMPVRPLQGASAAASAMASKPKPSAVQLAVVAAPGDDDDDDEEEDDSTNHLKVSQPSLKVSGWDQASGGGERTHCWSQLLIFFCVTFL